MITPNWEDTGGHIAAHHEPSGLTASVEVEPLEDGSHRWDVWQDGGGRVAQEPLAWGFDASMDHAGAAAWYELLVIADGRGLA